MALITILIGVVASFFSGKFMWSIVMQIDVSYSLIYEGWLRTWKPFLLSLPFALYFVVLALIARKSEKVQSINDVGLHKAFKLAVPIVIVLPCISLFIYFDYYNNESVVYGSVPLFISVTLLTYYTAPFLGLPYAYIWFKSIKELKNNSDVKFLNTILYFLFVLFFALVLFLMFGWVYALFQGLNPLTPMFY